MVTYPIFDEDYFSKSSTRIHLNSFIVIPLNVFAGILVLKFSPRTMEIYKYYLLNILIWSTLLDLFTTIIFVPILILPAPALCSNGPLRGFPAIYQFMIFILLLIGGAISLVVAFLYRYLRVKNRCDIIHSKKGLIMITIAFIILSAIANVVLLIAYYQTGSVNSCIEHVSNYFFTLQKVQNCSIS